MSMQDVTVYGGDIKDCKQDIEEEARGVRKEQRRARKWLVSLMLEVRDWTIGWRWESTNADTLGELCEDTMCYRNLFATQYITYLNV